MNGPLKTAATQRFNDALRSMLLVSKGDLTQMLEGERWAKIGKTKPGPKPTKRTMHQKDPLGGRKA